MNTMLKRAVRPAVLGLAVLGATAAGALAGDWNGGDGPLRRMSGSAAVPVPAPIPIPTYKPEWYFRLDAGIGFVSGDDGLSESGLVFGTEDTPGAAGPTPFGTRPSWFNDDFQTFGTFGGGVGRYWSDRFRTDVTVEARTKSEGIIDGTESYISHSDVGGVWTPDPNTRVDVHVRDTTSTRSVFSLVNAYYELGRHMGVQPYVGAGIGIAYNEITRSHSTSEETCDPTTGCTTSNLRNAYTASGKANTFSLAAALTAGLTYDLSDITSLDFNYRLLYVGGTSVRMAVTDPAAGLTSQSRVTIGDTLEHQLRAGLRFNIN